MHVLLIWLRETFIEAQLFSGAAPREPASAHETAHSASHSATSLSPKTRVRDLIQKRFRKAFTAGCFLSTVFNQQSDVQC